eukprot:CCRYP_004838-RA/>CCRYP_004838-RA protein AED:0.49 eAED:0.47 QI:0/0/0/1/0/0/2/0/68
MGQPIEQATQHFIPINLAHDTTAQYGHRNERIIPAANKSNREHDATMKAIFDYMASIQITKFDTTPQT